ncbi:MAG: Ca2+-dependent phosphoinositide-specific phospholipase C [Spirochaetales bacterium]|uniref:Ca2+-dependent phosphoinositide-specific phospholipase C n=1 Tax=Candidatus Thalassospirochaeta sargassi TaxID=3119039 RepID=A0AAJ1IK35_9SPIO|nr:Ca2+-dependent phosphoinositide-specific phospholipase C [Spirochaetales bacterium]
MKKFFRALLLTLLVIVLILLALVLSLRFSRNADKTEQAERLIRFLEQGTAAVSIPDAQLDDALPVNHLRYLATHNSYHHQAGPLQLALIELFKPGEAEKFRYSHLDFYRQLDIGVRSFELDLRYYRNGNFENIHIPLVDNRGHSPSFTGALEELKLWSDRHPQHVPVIIMMQTKDDWMFLDPTLKKWEAGALVSIDTLISGALQDRLITPDDITDGWPMLGDSRGKFIFVFHESEQECFNDAYSGHEGRVSFFMDESDSDETGFVLRNDPNAEDIAELIQNGFIVRTRADAGLDYSAEQRRKAISSGAQIVSTDYPLGYSSNPGEYSLGWSELISRYIY